ncbi:MAG: hypothetical protein HW406_2509 [Candidatus Brocadiaceae bacterium]|nr:hypothetical protein [Candidatus Brocadiaceae bacterium]
MRALEYHVETFVNIRDGIFFVSHCNGTILSMNYNKQYVYYNQGIFMIQIANLNQLKGSMTCEEQDTLNPVRQVDFEQRKTFSSTWQFLLSECRHPTYVIFVRACLP